MNLDFNTLKAEVLTEVEDLSADVVDRVPGFINEAYLEATLAVDPGLRSLRKVNQAFVLKTGQASVNLPGDARPGGLIYFGPQLTKEGSVQLVPSVIDLLQEFGKLDKSGTVEMIAIEHKTLWYHKWPAADKEFILVYDAEPPELVVGTDVPLHIPFHLQRNVLVYGASAKTFRLIEQETEQEVEGTRRYERLFAEGKSTLQEWSAKNDVSRDSRSWNV